MKTLATLLLLVLCNAPSFAQITLTSDQFQQYFTSGQFVTTSYNSTDVSGLPALINKSGPSQLWGFGNRVYTQTTDTATVTVFAYPGDAPLASDPDFAVATHVEKMVPLLAGDPTIYMFVKLDASGFYLLGYVQDSSGTASKVFSYNPPMQQLKFPLTYQTTWSSTSAINAPFFTPPISGQEVMEGTVDGYGTLNLPTVAHSKESGPMTSSECLRLKRSEAQIISTVGFSITTKTITFEWMTQDGNSANIVADSNLNPRSVGYSNGNSSGVTTIDAPDPYTFKIGANPVGTTTTIAVTLPNSGQTKVTLMDALGRESMVVLNGNMPSGPNTLSLDPSRLANGTYFLHVDAQGYNATRKLIVAH